MTVDLTKLQLARIEIAKGELLRAKADYDHPATYGDHMGGLKAATEILLSIISELTQ